MLKSGILMTILALFCAINLVAQTQYVGPNGGSWHDAANWNNGLPAAGNDANIFGSNSVIISQNLTFDYNVQSFAPLQIDANVVNEGVLSLSGGVAINESFTNNGDYRNLGGTSVIAASTSFNNTGTLTVQNGDFNCDGALSNSGDVVINTLFDSDGSFVNTGAVNVQGTFENYAHFDNKNGATINIANGAHLNNYVENTFQNRAGGIMTIFGFVDNLGTFINNGDITNDGFLTNESLMNNNNGGLIITKKEFKNNSTFNNNNNATFRVFNTPGFNKGTFNNNGTFDNQGPFTNEVDGIFNNVGTLININGSVYTNKGTLTSSGTIRTIGQVTNEGNMVNNGEMSSPNGGTLINTPTGMFTNNNMVTNLQIITNDGMMTNDGRFDNSSPGTLNNNAEFINKLGGFISNDFELNNYGDFQNIGQIENGVRLFNYSMFDNNGILENIGDFDNLMGADFNNAKLNGIGGVLNNNAGGIFTNAGTFNNENEVFVFECSEFVNLQGGAINNNYWFTIEGIFWDFGIINNTANAGFFYNGVLIDGPTSDEICENVSVALDADGTAKVTGVSLSVTSLDDCTTIFLTVDDEDELNYTCADLGQNTVTLTLEDRKDNSVSCDAVVTITDEVLPVLTACPQDIAVITETTAESVTWTAPTATDVCGPATLTSTHDSGDTFPLGTTQVTYTAVDPSGNSISCSFNVIVAPAGDCADIRNVRKVLNTKTSCGTGASYVMWLQGGIRYTAGDDLIFVDYKDNTALLTGTVYNGNERAYVEVVYSGRTFSTPADSPKLNNCVTSATSNWRYYPTVSGTVTFADGSYCQLSRRGPSFQIGTGANDQEVNKFGGSGWFTLTENGNSMNGDFNFRLSGVNAQSCENSITIEAECADAIGSKWKVSNDDSASGGKYLAPPTGHISYNTPPTSNSDILQYNIAVVESGQYRVFLRSQAPNGNSDSYWIQVNNGAWQKWNKVNLTKQGNHYDWDQASVWNGGYAPCPLSFHLNPGTNTIKIAWREPGLRLDKVFVTLIGKTPTGQGESVPSCNGNGGGTTPSCNKNALFVVGNTNLNTADNKLKQRLISLGYTVELADDNSVETADADGKGLILISATVLSGNVGSRFTHVNVPVIVSEQWLFDDMKMTSTTANTHYGQWGSTKKIRITNSNHPITAGISGDVTIFDAWQTIGWGMQVGGGQKLGHAPGAPSAKGMLFTYEEGAQMRGMIAPARRVGFFMRNNTANCFNNNGWALFDATVAWAANCANGTNALTNSEILTLQAAATDERTVNLNWTNNTAYKNELMMLERSLDGENFEVIDERYAHEEENNNIELYENTDATPEIGTNYYRIAIYHTDGSTSYSNVQVVNFVDLVDFGVYPNPTTDYVQVNLESVKGKAVSIRLFDNLGRPVLEEQIDEVTNNTHEINLRQLYDGRYSISIFVEGQRPVTKSLVILQ
jgi:hypothetical protein